jgi:nitrogen fixation NifU-like protein
MDPHVLHHVTHPKNRRALPEPCRSARQHNEHCPDKDEIVVYADVADGVLRRVSFEGHGCQLCVASASIMTTLVESHTRDSARSLTRAFEDFLIGQPVLEDLGDLRYFAGLEASFIPCVSLPWRALAAALNRRGR